MNSKKKKKKNDEDYNDDETQQTLFFKQAKITCRGQNLSINAHDFMTNHLIDRTDIHPCMMTSFTWHSKFNLLNVSWWDDDTPSFENIPIDTDTDRCKMFLYKSAKIRLKWKLIKFCLCNLNWSRISLKGKHSNWKRFWVWVWGLNTKQVGTIEIIDLFNAPE